MQRAQDQMQADQPKTAAQSAKDAREYLEQVQEELEEEQRRYEQLQQEEVLFRIVRDLERIQKRARASIRERSIELIVTAPRGRRLRRRDKKVGRHPGGAGKEAGQTR